MKKQEYQYDRIAQHQVFKSAAFALDCADSDDLFDAYLSRIVGYAPVAHAAFGKTHDQEVRSRSRP